MKPVHQTTFAGRLGNAQTGNCVQAAFASVLELPLEAVPHFGAIPGENHEWWFAIQEWVGKRGWFVLVLESEHQPLPVDWPIYAITAGKSPRGDWLHSVVYFEGKLAHDPHPDGTGILDVQDQWFLVPRDPGVWMRDSLARLNELSE